jgi:uncharacterized Zn-binding protein involved in type VI secretion
MGAPAANGASTVVGVDIHLVFVPMPAPVPTPLPHPFSGPINASLVPSVNIAGQPAAVVGSVANNSPAHVPTPPGTGFVVPPTNQGTVFMGSTTVRIGGKPAARSGDAVQTCNDPAPMPVGHIVAAGTVLIG